MGSNSQRLHAGILKQKVTLFPYFVFQENNPICANAIKITMNGLLKCFPGENSSIFYGLDKKRATTSDYQQ